MAKYEEQAKKIEDNYQRGIITAEEHDQQMDDLTTRLLEEFGR